MIYFNDKVHIGSTRKIDGGYIVAVSRVARVGVQDYLASEVGLSGNHIVKVYRPPEEVFSDKSLATYSHAPVTIGHPSELVNADNWSRLAVGEVSTAVKDDNGWVAVPLILKDQVAIAAISDGTKEISMGYTSILDHTSGVLPDGTEYDMIQRDIKINHLALVPNGRAGKEARIGDNSGKWGVSPQHKVEKNMEFTTIVMGDKAVQVAVTDANEIKTFISNLISDHAQELSDVKTKAKSDAEEKEEEFGKMKADLKTAKDSVLDDAAIDAKVAARVKLIADVKSIAPDITLDGVSGSDLVKQAVAVKLGDEIVKDASEAEIMGMFKAAVKGKVSTTVDNSFREVMVDGATTKIADQGWGVALTKVGANKAK